MCDAISAVICSTSPVRWSSRDSRTTGPTTCGGARKCSAGYPAVCGCLRGEEEGKRQPSKIEAW